MPPEVPRVVLDTNILIGAMYRRASASSVVVDACRNCRLQAVVSPALLAEYHSLLAKAVRVEGWRERFQAFLEGTILVEPEFTPRVVPSDPSDDMLFAAALAAGATAIISHDRAVLHLPGAPVVQVLHARQAIEVFNLAERF